MDINLGTEEKILNATIQCIDKYGLKDTTIRRIAKEAEVNSAAISYYFRSKDILINKAMELSLNNGFEWEDYLNYRDMPLKEGITYIFFKLVKGAHSFPGLTQAHFYDMFTNKNYNIPAVKKINEFLEKLIEDIKNNTEYKDDKYLRNAIIQIASAAFFIPAFMPQFFNAINELDLSNDDSLKEYIYSIVDKIL